MGRIRICISLAALLIAAPSFAEDEQGALVEKVAVRNRLFTADGRFELGVNFGFTLLTRLTEHYTFNLNLSYNIVNTFALELLGGYSYTRHTSLANDVAQQFLSGSTGNCGTTGPDPTNPTCAQDLSGLWEMVLNAVLGLRWQPLYGKINVFAELPVHFQFYISAGGGVGWFKRDSLVICNVKTGGECVDTAGNSGYYNEAKVGPLVTLAMGMRFFLPVVGYHHSIRVEIRDFSYLDTYLIGIDRDVALNPANPTGGGVPIDSPGITNLVQVHVGYSFMF